MDKKAFTLIELLVVIAIIGILSGIVVIFMSGATNAAKDSIRKSDISTLRKALLAYNTLNGSYPVATCADINSSCTALSDALIPGYLGILPSDPNSASSYSYTSTDGTDFTVAATLSDATGYSYTASTGFGGETGGGSSYVSTCELDMGGGISCTESTVGSYTIYTFTYVSAPGSTTWTVPAGVTSVEYLVIGGGGGASGYYCSGGGGAGGFKTNITGGGVNGTTDPNPTLIGSLPTITVGAGGAGTLRTSGRGNSGGASTFFDITADGGGGGGVYGNINGLSGGSGGGGSPANGTGGGASSGHSGGVGSTAAGNPDRGGGGGGAGGAGQAGAYSSGGNGGAGLASSITGSSVIYAGGGGGGSYSGGYGAAGSGGAGRGFTSDTSEKNAQPNTGSGGGGGAYSDSFYGGNGGSGIVIIRFVTP